MKLKEVVNWSRGRLRFMLDKYEIERSIEHLSGPDRFELSDKQVALILVGKNVAFFLDKFYDHHRSLGIDCFVFLDNGSEDLSVSIARGLEKTIVARTPADFAQYEALIRYFAITKFVRGGWRLVVDADELFDFPGRDFLGGLPGLIEALAGRNQTGLVAQMLDLVPPGPLSDEINATFSDAIRLCTSYSLADISLMDYHSNDLGWSYFTQQNSLTSQDVKLQFGGLRKTLFGEDCCLTKHPLFKMADGVIPQPHPHVSTGLHIADFTGLLRHYKFVGGFLERERSLHGGKRGADWEIELRMNAFRKNPDMSFLLPTSRFGPTTDDLLDAGFLVASEAARSILGLAR